MSLIPCKSRLLRWSILSLLTLLFLSACDGCQTRRCYGPSLTGADGELRRFSKNMAIAMVNEYCTYDQSSLLGDPNPNDDYSKIYLIRLDRPEVIDVTKELRQWWGVQGSIGNTERTLGPDEMFMNDYAIIVQKVDSINRQLWIFDPYSTPKMKKLGTSWLGDYRSESWGYYVQPWGLDSFMVAPSVNDLTKMDSTKSYFKIYSKSTGQGVDFKAPDGRSRWNDVVRLGDTLLTLRRVDSSVGYMYRYVGNRRDSIRLLVDSLLEKDYTWNLALRFNTSRPIGTFAAGLGVGWGGRVLISEMKIIKWGYVNEVEYINKITNHVVGESLYVDFKGKTIAYPHWEYWSKK